MVKAIIDITDEANRILNILKAKYGLNDKSEAINIMAGKYEEEFLEPQLRPEYIKKAERIIKQKAISVGTVANLRKRYE
ncbi:DUF2683 family protein [Candidatus Pacearchaeota archaeon]|nr:DUF2683 family protein [Candidatus Pacearchaeota archaeon]